MTVSVPSYNAVSLEQSPITRRRSADSTRFGSPRVRSSKRPASATIKEEEEPEPEEESDTHIVSNASSLKRAGSERRPSSRPLSGSHESMGHADQSKPTRSSSFGKLKIITTVSQEMNIFNYPAVCYIFVQVVHLPSHKGSTSRRSKW